MRSEIKIKLTRLDTDWTSQYDKYLVHKSEEYLAAHKCGQYTGNMWSKGYKDPHAQSHPQKDRKNQKAYTSGPSTRGQWNNVNTNVIR